MCGVIRRVKRSHKALGTKDFRNNREYYRVSCINKSNWDRRAKRKVYIIIHIDLSMVANSKQVGIRVSGIYRRVSSTSSSEVSDHLECRDLRKEGGMRT